MGGVLLRTSEHIGTLRQNVIPYGTCSSIDLVNTVILCAPEHQSHSKVVSADIWRHW